MKIVFVLGAAANKELDPEDAMPIGSELAARIQDQITAEFIEGSRFTEGPISDSIASSGGLTFEHVQAMRRIQQGITHVDSIDRFISEWSDQLHLSDVAKMAIAQQILQAETRTKFRSALNNQNSATLAMNAIRHSWLGQIFRYANPVARRRDVAECLHDISFVTFNYDRCLEAAIYLFLRSQDLSDESAVDLMSSLDIHHAYGSLGSFREFGGGLSDGTVPSFQIARSASRIQTFTEDVDSLHRQQVQTCMKEANSIVFLGFGFHELNLELICPSLLIEKSIIGTSYGMRAADKKRVSRYFSDLDGLIDLYDVECRVVMDQMRERIFGN